MTGRALIRTADASDLHALDDVVRRAYAEYEQAFPEWTPALRGEGLVTKLSGEAEILAATLDGGCIGGGVGYVAPGRPRAECFPRDWSVLRLMAVDPDFRGRGLASALVRECARRAVADGAPILGLYTSPAMEIAVAMYRRAGFRYLRTLEPVLGMPCHLYALSL
jgi:ribosomal protein S18 acetylase RimI-like enzyme